MRRDELIKRIMEADPENTREFCVNNADIYFLEPKPSYYDGRLEILIHDESKKPFYSIVGGKRTGKGEKVNIVAVSIRDCLLDDPDMPIDYSELSEETAARYRQRDEVTRIENRAIEQKIELENFTEWLKERTGISGDLLAQCAVREFNNLGLSYKDEFPKSVCEPTKGTDGWLAYPSYVQKRFAQWDLELAIFIDPDEENPNIVVERK